MARRLPVQSAAGSSASRAEVVEPKSTDCAEYPSVMPMMNPGSLVGWMR